MERQVIRFACIDNGVGSDCDDMMENGLAGTILEMPCGAGKYAVAHSVTDAEDQSIPSSLQGIQNKTVKQLSFDYRFDLAKRDSGDIFFRADYSNIGGYWNTFVDSPTDTRKRSTVDSLKRRFWDPASPHWGSLWQDIDKASAGKGSTFKADLAAKLVSMTKSCGSNSAFAEILSSGTASGSSRMGISMVGTISPKLHIEEVNAFMDTQLDLNVNLDFALYGKFEQSPITESLVQLPLVVDAFDHIGLISIAPTLKVDTTLRVNAGSSISANFSTGLHAFTSKNIVQSFPGVALYPYGQTEQQTIQKTFDGEVFDASGGSIKVDVQPRLGMQIVLNQYGTNAKLLDAFIEGGFDSYNALNINNDKTFSVQMGTGPASGELTYTRSEEVFAQWRDDDKQARLIGDARPAR